MVCTCTRAEFLKAGSPECCTPRACSVFFWLVVDQISLIYPVVYGGFCVCGRSLLCNAVMSEVKGQQHALSFTHCVRVNSLCSDRRDLQSPWSILTPYHRPRLWAGCWDSGASTSLCSQPLGWKCLQTEQDQFGGGMSAVDFVGDRTVQSPGLCLLGCDMVYLHVQAEGARSLNEVSLCVCVDA